MAALISRRVLRGATGGAAALLLTACSAAGIREGDIYLPVVNQIDSGSIAMQEGQFLVSLNAALLGGTAGDTLILSDPDTGVKFELSDATSIGTGEQVYEMDGKAGIDYLVITLRRIGSMESLSTRAFKDAGLVPFGDFFKVGGLAIQPLDGGLSAAAKVTVPIHTLNTDTSLELYKWVPSVSTTFSAPGTGKGASGSETVTGEWQFVSATVTDNADHTASFSVSSFGQYAVVADTLPGATP